MATGIYWIFFTIWLDEDVIGSHPNIQYPYLILSLIISTPSFVSLFGNTFISSFSDKTGRRKELMFISKLLLMSQCILLIFFGNSILNVLLIYGIFGFHTIYYILNSALITSICPPERRGEIASFQLLFASGGWAIGSGISSVIYTNFGMIGNLAISAAIAFLSGFIVLFSPTTPWSKIESLKQNNSPVNTVENEVQATPEESTISKSSKDLIKKRSLLNGTAPVGKLQRLKATILMESGPSATSYIDILKRKEVLSLLLILAVLDFGTGPIGSLSGLYLKRVNVPDFYISLSNSIATVIGMFILLFSGRISDKIGRRPVFLAGLIGYPIVYGLMGLLSNYWVAVFVFYSIPLYAIKVPLSRTIMSDITSERERGRGMNLIQFEQTFFMNVGGILSCYLVDIIDNSVQYSPIIPAIFGVIAIVLAFLLFRETNPEVLLEREKERNGILTD
jgi:MFS family permease